jgi:hypothetical protein
MPRHYVRSAEVEARASRLGRLPVGDKAASRDHNVERIIRVAVYEATEFKPDWN